MSNTLTNVKDIKVAQRALQPFMANLMPVSAFSTDFSPLPADKLDTVRVPLVGAPSESSDFAGDYTANADSTVTVVPVVLNRHKYKTVHVTARESAETALKVLETLVEAAAQQLAQDVLLDIFTAITAANYGAPGIPALAATSFDYKKVLSLREACGNAKMPPNPRALVLDAGYYTNLLADDVVAKSFNLNLNAPAVTEGMVKRLAGFALHETTIIPADHAEKLVGFAAHSSADGRGHALPPAGRRLPAGRCRHRPADRHDLRLPALHRHPRQQGLRHPRMPLRLRRRQDRRPQAHRQVLTNHPPTQPP